MIIEISWSAKSREGLQDGRSNVCDHPVFSVNIASDFKADKPRKANDMEKSVVGKLDRVNREHSLLLNRRKPEIGIVHRTVQPVKRY